MTATGGNDEVQARVTRLLLGALADDGFVLAGAGAIRAHGLTERPTHDIDLFTQPLISAEAFATAVEQASQVLGEAGFEVFALRRADTFARLRIHDTDGQILDVDMAVNWRAEPPVHMSVGPVLSERDAVAGKLSAVYSRGEVRDFLDLDTIRATGRYSDDELLNLGHEHDTGFDHAMFAEQLSLVTRFDADQAEEYGISADELTAIQQRTMTWATRLRDDQPSRQCPDPQ